MHAVCPVYASLLSPPPLAVLDGLAVPPLPALRELQSPLLPTLLHVGVRFISDKTFRCLRNSLHRIDDHWLTLHPWSRGVCRIPRRLGRLLLVVVLIAPLLTVSFVTVLPFVSLSVFAFLGLRLRSEKGPRFPPPRLTSRQAEEERDGRIGVERALWRGY